jgi:hypothetical protein
MIQDGVDYEIGYCKATEPGPDVEWTSGFDIWKRRSHPESDFKNCLRYRQPIKLQLQAGESYYMRNGQVVGDLEYLNLDDEAYPYWSNKHCAIWASNGKDSLPRPSEMDLVEHIPKQKEAKMNERMIAVNAWCAGTDCKSRLEVTLSEAERLGEEARKMREENKIKAGDFFMFNNMVLRALGTGIYSDKATKITNPAHIKALTEIYEAMK